MMLRPTRPLLAQATKYLFPAMSPTMESGTLMTWYKKEGESFKAGEALLKVLTDKAAIDVEAVENGTITKIVVPEGTTDLPVNSLVAYYVEEGTDLATVTYPSDDDTKPASASQPAATSASPAASPAAASAPTKRMLSPAVAHLTATHGIDPKAIPASGPHGHLLKGDVLQFLATSGEKKAAAPAPAAVKPAETKAAAPAEAAPKAATSQGDYIDIPVSQMRAVIARRLTESKTTVPHAYTQRTICVDNVLSLRKRLNTPLAKEEQITFNDIVIKAVAVALREVPEVNVLYKNGEVIPMSAIDVSVAVAIDGGLITPIVKNADNLGLRGIASSMKSLGAKARTGKLKPEEYQGGTFSVSNLGPYGIREFTSIISPPQAAILSVASITKAVVLDEDGAPKVRNMLTVQISTDQRAVDHEQASRFLEALHRNLEHPENMLLG